MTDTASVVQPTGAIAVDVELEIAAPREQVWDAFVTKIGEWWRDDFLATGSSAKFAIDLKLGGYMYEDAGNGAGLIWFTILGIWPNERLYVAGYTRPPYGGPATGLITFELEDKGDGTLFKVSDATHGHVTEAVAAGAETGWRMLFTELKNYVENR